MNVEIKENNEEDSGEENSTDETFNFKSSRNFKTIAAEAVKLVQNPGRIHHNRVQTIIVDFVDWSDGKD